MCVGVCALCSLSIHPSLSITTPSTTPLSNTRTYVSLSIHPPAHHTTLLHHHPPHHTPSLHAPTCKFPDELLRGMRRGVWIRRLDRRTSSVMTAASLVRKVGANQGKGPINARTGGWSLSSNSRATSLGGWVGGWLLGGVSMWLPHHQETLHRFYQPHPFCLFHIHNQSASRLQAFIHMHHPSADRSS